MYDTSEENYDLSTVEGINKWQQALQKMAQMNQVIVKFTEGNGHPLFNWMHGTQNLTEKHRKQIHATC